MWMGPEASLMVPSTAPMLFLLVSSLLTEGYVTQSEGLEFSPKQQSESGFFFFFATAGIFSAGICFMQIGFRGFSWMLLFHLTCKG